MKKILLLIVVIILSGSFIFVTRGNEYANDYYDAINKKFLSKDYLGDDKYIYNVFTEAQDSSDKVLDDIVLDVVDSKIDIGTSGNNIKKLYNEVMDINKRNKLGTYSLDKYINSIMDSKDINEFINMVVVIEKELGVDIFTRKVVDNDFLDNTKNIIYLYPVTFAFGSSGDYFVDDDYMSYKAYIKRAIINLLEEYGYSKSEARLVSSEVVSFYTNISKGSKLSSDFEDVENYYNIVDSNYIRNIYNNLDIDKYFYDSDIDLDKYKYSLVDEEQYKNINKYLNDEYLLVWKKCVLVKILSSYAMYLDIDYREIVNNLNNDLTGSSENITLEDDAIDIVSGVFRNEFDKLYDKKVISDLDKTYLKDLFDDIKKSFRDILMNNEWLSDKTLDYALDKLDAMKVYVGVYEEYESNILVEGDNLVDNIISINKSNYYNELKRLDDNSDVKAMGENVVNAYYSPMDNAVYIPSSVMFLLNDNDNYYERLGTIGMVIAHEVTHGFDFNGSKFDCVGNLNNWWNDEDRDNFLELKDKVSDYYGKIEVINGKFINGDKTVNENIADMGALKIITRVAVLNGASNYELKNMYESYAKFWRSQETSEYAKLLLLNDSHSPSKYRVNAVLSLVDEFYNVYNIFPWNDMYISNRNRVSVW